MVERETAMKLTILYKDGEILETVVTVVWQDIRNDFDLYYETPLHEQGKGIFVPLEYVKTWKVTSCDIGGNIKL